MIDRCDAPAPAPNMPKSTDESAKSRRVLLLHQEMHMKQEFEGMEVLQW